jgi:hypothetical protein
VESTVAKEYFHTKMLSKLHNPKILIKSILNINNNQPKNLSRRSDFEQTSKGKTNDIF